MEDRVSREAKLNAAKDIVTTYIRSSVMKNGEDQKLELSADQICTLFRQVYETIEEVDAILPTAKFLRSQLPWEAAFLASRCFLQYRARGGTRRSPMPDFYIGAHAVISGMSLLTRDATRYQTYFPKLRLITPKV